MALSTLHAHLTSVMPLHSEHVKSISKDHLKKMMDAGERFTLLDVRGRQDYEKEHIKGAVSLPLDEVEKKAMQTLKPDDHIVTYCDSFICSSSTSGAKMLARKGFKDVRDYKGGLREWKQAGLPTESGY